MNIYSLFSLDIRIMISITVKNESLRQYIAITSVDKDIIVLSKVNVVKICIPDSLIASLVIYHHVYQNHILSFICK